MGKHRRKQKASQMQKLLIQMMLVYMIAGAVVTNALVRFVIPISLSGYWYMSVFGLSTIIMAVWFAVGFGVTYYFIRRRGGNVVRKIK